MFTTLVALGVVAIQIGIVVLAILWITKSPLLQKVYQNSHIIIATIFIASVLGSLIYEYILGYEPCLLCWYQRIAIFGVAILSLTGDIRKNKTLQNQIFIFSVLGLLVAILHNYIDIIPSGLDLCGAGPSCLKRYTHVFGYITIPMMSLTALLAGTVLSIFTISYSKKVTALK
jgi:disulfide bond formation protein DsbB